MTWRILSEEEFDDLEGILSRLENEGLDAMGGNTIRVSGDYHRLGYDDDSRSPHGYNDVWFQYKILRSGDDLYLQGYHLCCGYSSREGSPIIDVVRAIAASKGRVYLFAHDTARPEAEDKSHKCRTRMHKALDELDRLGYEVVFHRLGVYVPIW